MFHTPVFDCSMSFLHYSVKVSLPKVSCMDDGPRGIQIFPDHFGESTSGADSPRSETSSAADLTTSSFLSSGRTAVRGPRRKFKSAASMLNLFSLKGLSWGSGASGQEKVVLSAVEVASLRSEIGALEERESHYKAQLEHVDELLRSARLSGYLFVRTRWATLPGEPLPIDDTEVDDWLPRFLVLHGSCIYLYMAATDLSPQDSTLLSDIVEVGPLPCLKREDAEIRHCFFILTSHGMRYECSSISKIQVDSWLATLQIDCKLVINSDNSSDSRKA